MKNRCIYFYCLVSICLLLFSCVERGKPIEKAQENTNKQQKKTAKLEHYICKNGHKGSDVQGVCPECKVAYTHNQAFHGLSIPQNSLQDPFQKNNNSNAANTPAQNAYGDYHYTCPNGHAGGSGVAGTCSSCSAKLAHNQNYHR